MLRPVECQYERIRLLLHEYKNLTLANDGFIAGGFASEVAILPATEK